MTAVQQTFSPIDGALVAERELASLAAVDRALDRAVAAARGWRQVDLTQRLAVGRAFVVAMSARAEQAADELTLHMGRPRSQTPGELAGLAERALAMIELAPEALADVVPAARAGFTRFVRREPLGVVLVLAPWNYPYLTAVNAVIPALMAGNAVILKHSDQTPTVPEHFAAALADAGLPDGVFQVLHADHATVAAAVADPRVDFVAFTGSVEGGRAVHRAAAGQLKAVGLELGGKDPAYVRHDADLAFAVENLVDGAMFNSGQSCCGIERIYVHDALFDEFVDAAAALIGAYRLGDPRLGETNLGPVVRPAAAAHIGRQVRAALAAGARRLVEPSRFAAAVAGSAFVAPELLVDVDHTMDLMVEETFGPVVGVMRVRSDDEAVALMNDSPYGLTASLWTADEQAALSLGGRLQTGTVFMNRCDYLDPELAWVGVKLSGRGCTLSRVGYEHMTRPKSFHLRVSVPGRS